ncbi:MAG: DUF4956 domain-containing protein [Clostridia bacterium]|nr:DUF4956 domain-containing protein [Clostridia bacterium]
MFSSIFESSTVNGLEFSSAGLLGVAGILMGILMAFVYMKTTKQYSKNFIVSLAILPVLVMIAILMVNGNLGVSFAIAGIFGLVRFRSIPGNSKEILATFLAVVIGLALGRGYITFAAAITVVVSLLMFVYSIIPIGSKDNDRKLKVVIPENLNYLDAFDEIFTKYTKTHELEKVKTTNMGAMYELSYVVSLKNDINEKAFLDDLRVRNGNLNIILSKNSDEDVL